MADSNAERASCWELMVLASHVHPSVATMARTLLSGANIVYNGNPLNDLSLVAFLDKFMEKKPKQSTWHGASEIEPAKKLEMNHQLIGPEILSLSEADVPPEDVVFHKFYSNKMNAAKKPKKKKKKALEDEAAEELYPIGSEDDESDNEEIDTIIEKADDPPLDSDGEYDYNDLDKVANEDDELLEDGSEEEIILPSEFSDGEPEADEAFANDADDNMALEDDEGAVGNRKKRKSSKRAARSPFASIEDYEHLMKEDDPETKASTEKKQPKAKKRKHKHN